MGQSFSRFWLEELEAEIRLCYGSRKHHKTIFRFLHNLSGMEEIQFSDLTYSFIDDFDKALHRKGLSQGTVYNYHKTIRRYLNLAIKKDIIQSKDNPYNKFRIWLDRRCTNRQFLDRTELALFEAYRTDNPQKQAIIDMFLFGCYTGLRFSDLVRIDKTMLTHTQNGIDLRIKAKKTGKMIILPIYLLFGGKGEVILKKYLRNDSRPLFGQILGQYKVGYKFNRILKAVTEELGICKLVTSHVARHTFATILAELVPPRILQELLQHSNIETTMLYVHLTNAHIKKALGSIAW